MPGDRGGVGCLAAVILSLALGACASAPVPAVDPFLAGARSYAGVLSCSACPERSIVLTVLADGSFRLRQSEPAASSPDGSAAAVDGASSGASRAGAPAVSYQFGRWMASPQAADVLELHGHDGVSWLLRRVAPDALLVLDNEGRAIRGLDNARLARAPEVVPLDGPFRLVGHYRHEASQRVFVECLTGQRLLVAAHRRGNGAGASAPVPAAAQRALDAALQALSPQAGEAVLVVVRGYLLPRQAQPTSPERESLVVTAFERATRGGRCNDAMPGVR